MKYPFRSHILPRFTVGAGSLGLILRIWLFSATDEKGLLPRGHFADSSLYILTALVLVVLLLSTRKLTPRHLSKQSVRLSNTYACILAGVGLILTGVLTMSNSPARLAWVATVGSLLGGLVMLLMAFLYATRRRIHYSLPAIITIVLMLDAVTQCQVWGAVPQLQEYCFPLLASVFLIFTAYYKTSFVARRPKPKSLAFCSQCALFFCLLSLNSSQWLLYASMLCWAAVQIYPCTVFKKKV